MAERRLALLRLDEAISDFLREYREKRHVFADFPKVNEDIFALWDDYLVLREREKTTTNSPDDDKLHASYKQKTKSLIEVSEGFHKSLMQAINGLFETDSKRKIEDLVEDAFNDPNLPAFFGHDMTHVYGDMAQGFWVLSPLHTSSRRAMAQRRDQVRNLIGLYNRDPEFIFGSFVQPFKMLQFMTDIELRKSPKTESFSPSNIAWQIAYILHGRYVTAEYSVVPELTSTNQNEIAVNAENFAVTGNPGVIFSIIYNAAKNSYKKLKGRANSSNKIFIQVYEAPFSSYVITVGDNGKPIDLNAMKEQIRKAVMEKGIDGVTFPTDRLKRKIQGWQQSEYKVGDLTLTDITDVAFMSRMSGFEIPNEFSSGMGLYGIRYFVQRMGGRILYGEDIKTGSPLFTFVLPKEMPANRLQRALYSIGPLVEAARLHNSGNFRRAA